MNKKHGVANRRENGKRAIKIRSISQEIADSFHNATTLLTSNILGKGTQSSVYASAVMSRRGKMLACAAKENPSQSEIHAYEITRKLSSKESGLLKLIGLFNQTNNKQYAIFPRCDVMLAEILSNIFELQNSNNKYFPYVILDILDALIRALDTLQKNKMVHGDISLKNMALRLTESNEIMFVLIDLGLAKKHEDFKKGAYGVQGTPFFMAPEITVANATHSFCDHKDSSSSYSSVDTPLRSPLLKNPEAIDIYSAGCLLKKLFTFQESAVNVTPFVMIVHRGIEYEQARQKDRCCDAQEKKSPCNNWLMQMRDSPTFEQCIHVLITQMCQLFPENRSTLKEIKEAQMVLHAKWPALSNIEQKELVECYKNLLKRNDSIGNRNNNSSTFKLVTSDNSSNTGGSNNDERKWLIRTPELPSVRDCEELRPF